jgi:uroporphyrinogen-III synthase
VLITRPEPGAGETARRVAALGLHPVLAPVLAIATRPIPPIAAQPQAMLVTSGNAIPALPEAWHGCMLLAVGDGTAARARAAGFARCHSAAGDAAALEALVAKLCTPAGGALLLASGEGQGMRLAASLRARGFRVIRRVVYAARPARVLPEAARAALAQGGLGAALFFSRQTARAFVRLLLATTARDIVADIEAIAISKSTASALTPLPWRRIRVASRPNQDEMLALLQ